MTDRELLFSYATKGSRQAFAEIVRRYAGLVYSTCLRVLGDPHAAEDAAQAVFLLLARKASGISEKVRLPGWLFLTAENLARRARTTAVRRGRHEREAAEMQAEARPPGPEDWEALRPHLDAALAALPAAQREALTMRFLVGMAEQDMCRELGCGQSTVAMRISRGLEKLRTILARGGVTAMGAGAVLTTGALARMLSERGLEALPTGLATSLTLAATGAAAPSVGAMLFFQQAAKAAAWIKIKLVAAVMGSVLLVGGAGGILAMKSRAPVTEVPGEVVLDEGSWWRAFITWRTPRGNERDFIVATPAPPEGWTAPGFQDSSWSRWRLPRTRDTLVDYGWKGPGPSMAVQCLRGRFTVADPGQVQGMFVSMTYRGGVIVSVNGTEIARGHLSKDEAQAEGYPPDVFEHSEVIRGTRSILSDFGQPDRFKASLEKRIRVLKGVRVDPALLRKGTNVLSVECRRAPFFGGGLEQEHPNTPIAWSTGGLVSLKLTAAEGAVPNLSRPAGPVVWTSTATRTSRATDFPDLQEPPEPIRIVGCRNGRFDGKLFVGSPTTLGQVKVTTSDLVEKSGNRKIGDVKVLYTLPDLTGRLAYRFKAPEGGFWDALSETAPSEVPPQMLKDPPGPWAVQPVVLSVSVPVDAAPGDYEGRVAVFVAGAAVADVPLQVKVIAWKLPNPREFTTHMGVVQSPESVALEYRVPLWSEEHWRLTEQSFRRLGEIGNKYIVLPLICRTNFGNAETLVRWVKVGSGYRHDFSIFDRYLDVALRHTKPDVVCLYAWDMYAGGHSERWKATPNGVGVTLVDPATGKTEEMEGPAYDRPEAREFWAPVYRGIRERLTQRGLLSSVVMGIGREFTPLPEATALFKELLPEAGWAVDQVADVRGQRVNDLPVGYNSAVWNFTFPPPGQADPRLSKDGYHYGWNHKDKTAHFPAWSGPVAGGNPMYPVSSLALHRIYAEACLMGDLAGLGRLGADFWPVLGDDRAKSRQIVTGPRRSASLNACYPASQWGDLDMGEGTEALLAPGPQGALPTERFEQIREGLQDCEARIFLEKALIDPALKSKLGEPLAGKCRAVLDERAWMIRAACIGHNDGMKWYEGAGAALREKLFSVAAEAAKKLGSN